MERINVTKSFLPPLEEYEKYLQKIWDAQQLTNQGPLLQELEQKIKAYLNLENDIQFVTNGTVALQIALHSLDITEGEVITTPFSYVATTSSILWERCKPIFVDIEQKTFCIDADKIEAAITPNTKAILAVHVFGNPCDIEKIEAISKKHSLPVIYDAAHSFGVKYKGKSLLDYGDISVCSFHATKVFHTIEGGCVVSRDKQVSNKIELIKRFGHNLDDHSMLGINAKASEFHAAMGLCNLEYIESIIKERQSLSELYDKLLPDTVYHPQVASEVQYNYAYYAVLLKDEPTLLSAIAALAEENIYPRRYFYPSLNVIPYINSGEQCPISEDIASRVMCLPLYAGLESESVRKICRILNSV